MTERHIHAVQTEDPGLEEPAATRERLRDLFPRGASRRMTQLGLLVGGVLAPIELREEDTLVYASTYAEGRALEDYLAGFPTPSPTLFQTSIQPSAVQQVLIARRQSVRQFLPLAGRLRLATQALLAGLLADTPRAIVCGGEERGARLRELGVTSAETFAFAVELTDNPDGAIGTLRLDDEDDADEADLPLPALFLALHARWNLRRRLAPGGRSLAHMALNPVKLPALSRNPGPDWGYHFLCRADAVLPAPVCNFLLGLGCAVAVAAMPVPRRHSREYLGVVLGRPARLADVWRHFYAFAESLLLKLRVAEGGAYDCVKGPDCAEFTALAESGPAALFGTFHFGHSDLLGFMLGQFGRPIRMIRLRVENSRDTDRLAHRFGDFVTYLWVNETETLLFSLKEALESGASVAMKCDRPEHSAKLEAFEFLGQKRLFPFTIYHLALIFRRPVVFCVSLPHGRNASLVHSSPVFRPTDGPRAGELARARRHFQEFLGRIESWLHQDPFLWSNFLPLNPVAPAGPG